MEDEICGLGIHQDSVTIHCSAPGLFASPNVRISIRFSLGSFASACFLYDVSPLANNCLSSQGACPLGRAVEDSGLLHIWHHAGGNVRLQARHATAPQHCTAALLHAATPPIPELLGGSVIFSGRTGPDRPPIGAIRGSLRRANQRL